MDRGCNLDEATPLPWSCWYEGRCSASSTADALKLLSAATSSLVAAVRICCSQHHLHCEIELLTVKLDATLLHGSFTGKA